MANAINYAERYQTELDQTITQATLTSQLETPNVNWMGAKTFHVPNLSVTGYQDHSRNGGFNRGDVTMGEQVYTLSMDRDVEFFVDRADVDESNQVASAGNLTRVFMNEKAGPEIDAYRFSKLATRANTEGNTTAEAIDATNVFTRLKEDIKKVRKYGPVNLIAYLSSDAMDALERSEQFVRNINVQNGGTAIETRVTSLDGVQLVEVWDVDRFNTEHDFTTGFSPSGLDLNWIIVNRGSIVCQTKLNSVYLFEPGQHTQGDGFLYQNRLYHDLFVLDNKADGVITSTVETAA